MIASLGDVLLLVGMSWEFSLEGYTLEECLGAYLGGVISSAGEF